MNQMNWLVSYPEILLLVAACVVALVDLSVTDPKRSVTFWLTQASLAAVAFMHAMALQPGHLRDDQVHVIANALEVFGHQQQPRSPSGSSRIIRHTIQQIVKHAIIKLINFVIAFNDGARGFGVACGKSVERQTQHFARQPAHFGQVEIRFELRFVVQVNRCARNIAGMIGDAFQNRRDFDGRDDLPQIVCIGRMQRQQTHTKLISFQFQRVYAVIIAQNLFG